MRNISLGDLPARYIIHARLYACTRARGCVQPPSFFFHIYLSFFFYFVSFFFLFSLCFFSFFFFFIGAHMEAFWLDTLIYYSAASASCQKYQRFL